MRQYFRSSICFLSAIFLAHSAMARSFIRDAEIEDTLRLMTAPILSAAKIEPDSVRLFIINDPSINAFVAGGKNIFFHTGLLLQTENSAQLMGVIAHETGHISGAHLTQLQSASDDASLGALLSVIIGAAAVIAGSPQGGAAIMHGGQNSALRNLLSHYRGNEQQADQAAVGYMRDINLSPAGMLEMFEIMRRNERQHLGSGGDVYLRTYPSTTDRIAALRAQTNKENSLPRKPSEAIQKRFARMQAKLFAFLSPPAVTLTNYPDTDRSEAAILARAVAYFKQPDLGLALQEIDQLIAIAPTAFSYDIKGQILFEHGRISQAISTYETANRLAPENGLILADLGKAYLATEDKSMLSKSVSALERASQKNDAGAGTHRHLATAYGKQGKLGQSYLSLAREAALNNEPDNVIRHSNKAKEYAKNNPVLTLQAEDLIRDAKQVKDKQE